MHEQGRHALSPGVGVVNDSGQGLEQDAVISIVLAGVVRHLQPACMQRTAGVYPGLGNDGSDDILELLVEAARRQSIDWVQDEDEGGAGEAVRRVAMWVHTWRRRARGRGAGS